MNEEQLKQLDIILSQSRAENLNSQEELRLCAAAVEDYQLYVKLTKIERASASAFQFNLIVVIFLLLALHFIVGLILLNWERLNTFLDKILTK